MLMLIIEDIVLCFVLLLHYPYTAFVELLSHFPVTTRMPAVTAMRSFFLPLPGSQEYKKPVNTSVYGLSQNVSPDVSLPE